MFEGSMKSAGWGYVGTEEKGFEWLFTGSNSGAVVSYLRRSIGNWPKNSLVPQKEPNPAIPADRSNTYPIRNDPSGFRRELWMK